jgi:hypothetical protein
MRTQTHDVVLVLVLALSVVTAGCLRMGSRNRRLEVEHLRDTEERGPALDLPPNETRERVPRLVNSFNTTREAATSVLGTVDDDAVAWEIMDYLNETAREAGGPAFTENETIDGRVNWTGDQFRVRWGGSIG